MLSQCKQSSTLFATENFRQWNSGNLRHETLSGPNSQALTCGLKRIPDMSTQLISETRQFSSLTECFLPGVMWVSSKRMRFTMCFINKETSKVVADPYLERAARWFCLIGPGETLVLVLISIQSTECCKWEVGFQRMLQNGKPSFQPKGWNILITNIFIQDKLEIARASKASLYKSDPKSSEWKPSPGSSTKNKYNVNKNNKDTTFMLSPFRQKTPLRCPYAKNYYAFWQLRKQTRGVCVWGVKWLLCSPVASCW